LKPIALSSNLKVLLIAPDTESRKIGLAISGSGMEHDIDTIWHYDHSIHAGRYTPDIIIALFKGNAETDLLLDEIRKGYRGIPLVMVMDRVDYPLSVYYNLIKGGVTGFIDSDRLDAVNHHLAMVINRIESVVVHDDISEVTARQGSQESDKARSHTRNYYFEKYLPFGVFDCDRSGKILYANNTFFNILEIPDSDRTGISMDRFFQNDGRFIDYLGEINEGESSTFSQLQMITSAGTEIFARISTHVRNDENSGLVVNGILEDNTREVLLEKKLSSTHRMETLGTLAGGIAHDFNTILTTISGYSELTMDEVEPGSVVSDYMSKVNHAIKRAESVINQMLTFSRQIDLEKIPVKVSDVIREATDFMRSAIPYNVRLESETEDPELIVLADPTQLFRVLLNIMTNSAQAMEQNGGVLSVTLAHETVNNRNFADIRIADTGSGIDKSVIDRIYEPFFTTKEVGKGTGMGLSVAHGIVTELGGELNVESLPGAGTTFLVRLPVTEMGLRNDSHPGSEPLRTIMYADENLYFSRTVSLALERMGYRVLLASDMDDMALIMRHSRSDVDIFFIRCGFSKAGGAEIVQRIAEVNRDARIVLITKPGSDTYRNILKEERNRVSVINEPVSLHEIMNAINEYS